MNVAHEETYGQEFRRIRKELGLTQVEAAEACGVSLSSVAIWESNRREFNTRESAALIRRSIATLKRKREWRDRKR